VGDDFGEARAALERGDFGALAEMLEGQRLDETNNLFMWVCGQVGHSNRGRQFIAQLLEERDPVGLSDYDRAAILETWTSSRQEELEPEDVTPTAEELRADLEELEALSELDAGDLPELLDPFEVGGEFETARALSEGNPRALALCEMASAVAACAVDVAQAPDDDEAAEALRRALATLEHIGAELLERPEDG
jgi:hypothetical protein